MHEGALSELRKGMGRQAQHRRRRKVERQTTADYAFSRAASNDITRYSFNILHLVSGIITQFTI